MKELLDRYYRGETSREEESLLARHFAEHPSDDEPLLSSLADMQAAEAVQKRLEQRFAAPRPRRRGMLLLTWPRAVAACVIAAVCCVALFRPATVPSSEALTEEEARVYLVQALTMLNDAAMASSENLSEVDDIITNSLTPSQL